MKKANVKNGIPVDLTDEQILSAFVKRFECDGAILVYLDGTQEYGFSNCKNAVGKAWAQDVFRVLQKEPRATIEINQEVISPAEANQNQMLTL